MTDKKSSDPENAKTALIQQKQLQQDCEQRRQNHRQNHWQKSWALSGRLYQQNSIQTACLLWQNNANANVNLILLLAIYQAQNYVFKSSDFLLAIQKVEAFSAQTSQKIRSARFFLKETLAQDEYNGLKKKLLSAELECEYQEQKIIHQTFIPLLLSHKTQNLDLKNSYPHNQTSLTTKPLNDYLVSKKIDDPKMTNTLISLAKLFLSE